MKMLNANKLRLYYIVLIGVIFALNFCLIFNNNVWCDEAFVLNACRLNGFKELFKYIAYQDMRPPLYLIGAKLYTCIVGVSVPALKIFSLIPTFLTMLLGATKIHKNFGNDKVYVGTSFILLTGLSPMGMTKNIEITIYSWVMFWVVCSIVLAYELYFYPTSRKKWGAFVLCALGAAATHYYGVLTEIFIYLFLFIALVIKNRKLLAKCIIISIITIVCYVPILPFFYYQFTTAKKNFWIRSTDIYTLLSSIRAPFEGENAFKFCNDFTALFWILVIGMQVYVIYTFLNEKKKRTTIIYFYTLCCITMALFLICGFILSRLIRPLYIDRYFYVMVGVLWLVISISAEIYVENVKQFCLYVGMILCMFVFAYPSMLDREYSSETKELVAFIDENISTTDIFINNIEECANWEIEYYFPNHKTYLNRDEGIYYKDSKFDFSTLETTAWYICSGELDISQDILDENNLKCQWIRSGEFDHYYYFDIYKISKK